jgi:hypothetical protein
VKLPELQLERIFCGVAFSGNEPSIHALASTYRPARAVIDQRKDTFTPVSPNAEDRFIHES